MGALIDHIAETRMDKMETYGYINKPNIPVCPCCGEDVDQLAYGYDGTVIGCSNCIEWRDAYDIND